VRSHRVAKGTAVLALCVWCGWASGFHRTTPGAEITWLVAAGAVVAFDVALWRVRSGGSGGLRLQPVSDPWPRRGPGGSEQALRGVASWLGFIAVIVAWEILGIDTGPHQYHLTISALAQAYRPLNAALLLVWVLVGVGYEAARVRTPVDWPGGWRHGGPPKIRGDGPAFAVAVRSFGTHQGTTGLLLPQSPGAGVAFWVAVPMAAVLIDAAARRSAGRRATAEEFVRFISTARPANLALIAAWGFAGYHLFAR
jgi:hypothetical protein